MDILKKLEDLAAATDQELGTLADACGIEPNAKAFRDALYDAWPHLRDELKRLQEQERFAMALYDTKRLLIDDFNTLSAERDQLSSLLQSAEETEKLLTLRADTEMFAKSEAITRAEVAEHQRDWIAARLEETEDLARRLREANETGQEAYDKLSEQLEKAYKSVGLLQEQRDSLWALYSKAEAVIDAMRDQNGETRMYCALEEYDRARKGVTP